MMANTPGDSEPAASDPDKLREQAERHLSPAIPPGASKPRAADALAVLHRLASQSDSAVDALKLLHELQVHQVELELQHEELERSRAELSASRDRYAKLFAFAPVAYLSVQRDATILESNPEAALLLNADRHRLRGRKLTDFLVPSSRPAYEELLAQVERSLKGRTDKLALLGSDALPRVIRVEAAADPAGQAFLMILIDTTKPASA